jgi:hypothetical protein
MGIRFIEGRIKRGQRLTGRVRNTFITWKLNFCDIMSTVMTTKAALQILMGTVYV